MDDTGVRSIGDVFLKLGFQFDETSYKDAMDKATKAAKDYKTADAMRADAQATAAEQKKDEKKKVDNDSKTVSAISTLNGVAENIAAETIKILQGIFGIIKNVANRLEQASPMLQAIHTLFNTAMTLFFMPIGNKLGEVMIPAVLKMIERAVAFWDELDKNGLSMIFERALDYLVSMLSDYFTDLGNTFLEKLNGDDSMLGFIASTLIKIGNFIRNLPNLLNTGLGLIKLIIDNIGAVIGVIIGFKAASLAMQVVQVAATLFSAGGWGAVGIGLAAVAGIGIAGTVGGLVVGGVMTSGASGGSGGGGGNTYNYNITNNGSTLKEMNNNIMLQSGTASSNSAYYA